MQYVKKFSISSMLRTKNIRCFCDKTSKENLCDDITNIFEGHVDLMFLKVTKLTPAHGSVHVTSFINIEFTIQL